MTKKVVTFSTEDAPKDIKTKRVASFPVYNVAVSAKDIAREIREEVVKYFRSSSPSTTFSRSPPMPNFKGPTVYKVNPDEVAKSFPSTPKPDATEDVKEQQDLGVAKTVPSTPKEDVTEDVNEQQDLDVAKTVSPAPAEDVTKDVAQEQDKDSVKTVLSSPEEDVTEDLKEQQYFGVAKTVPPSPEEDITEAVREKQYFGVAKTVPPSPEEDITEAVKEKQYFGVAKTVPPSPTEHGTEAVKKQQYFGVAKTVPPSPEEEDVTEAAKINAAAIAEAEAATKDVAQEQDKESAKSFHSSHSKLYPQDTKEPQDLDDDAKVGPVTRSASVPTKDTKQESPAKEFAKSVSASLIETVKSTRKRKPSEKALGKRKMVSFNPEEENYNAAEIDWEAYPPIYHQRSFPITKQPLADVFDITADDAPPLRPSTPRVKVVEDEAGPSTMPSSVPLERSRTISALPPAPESVEESLTPDVPRVGRRKTLLRKARNVALPTPILKVLLGRELADQTKEQLRLLARGEPIVELVEDEDEGTSI